MDILKAAEQNNIAPEDAKKFISSLLFDAVGDMDLEIPTNIDDFIVWSKISETLTDNERQIRKGYSGKRYLPKVNMLRKLVALWIEWEKE